MKDSFSYIASFFIFFNVEVMPWSKKGPPSKFIEEIVIKMLCIEKLSNVCQFSPPLICMKYYLLKQIQTIILHLINKDENNYYMQEKFDKIT